MITNLNVDEQKLLKKLIQVQIENLKKLLPHNIEKEKVMTESNIDEKDMNLSIKKSLRKWLWVSSNPCQVLNLDKDHLSLLRHILNNYYQGVEYDGARKGLWKKLFTLEEFNKYYNPN
jgi:hypothetical protein